MRGAVIHLALGALLVAGGVGATLLTDGQVLWWGAVVAGIIELARGLSLVVRTRSA